MSGRMAEYIPIMRLLRVHETYHDPSQAIGLGFFIAYYLPRGVERCEPCLIKI